METVGCMILHWKSISFYIALVTEVERANWSSEAVGRQQGPALARLVSLQLGLQVLLVNVFIANGHN